MGNKQSKPTISAPKITIVNNPTADDASDITRPAPRRQLRTLSMLIDPMQLVSSDNETAADSRPGTAGPQPSRALSPSDYLKPANMFDFERPLSIRERQERVRARIAALHEVPQQRYRTCTRRKRFMRALRRMVGCGNGDTD